MRGKKTRPHAVVTNAKAAAANLGIGLEAVERARSGGSDAFDRSGRIDLKRLKSWLVEHREEIMPKEGEMTAQEAKRQKTIEEWRKLKISNDLKETKLMLRSEYDSDFAGMSAEITGLLNQMPQRLAPDLAGLGVVDIEQRLTAACDEVIRKLSE